MLQRKAWVVSSSRKQQRYSDSMLPSHHCPPHHRLSGDQHQLIVPPDPIRRLRALSHTPGRPRLGGQHQLTILDPSGRQYFQKTSLHPLPLLHLMRHQHSQRRFMQVPLITFVYQLHARRHLFAWLERISGLVCWKVQ